MAYARYDRTCEWYIFWQSTSSDEARARAGSPRPKAEEELAVWHCSHRAETPTFTYAQVREMLDRADFGRIPGFAETDRDLIVGCLSEFVREVDAERGPA